MAVHTGTHVDAPCHAVAGGRSVEEIPLEVWATTGHVARVDTAGAEPITRDQVAKAVGDVRPGEAVIIDTGWGEHRGTDRYQSHPYFSEGLATWLVDREVAWVGIDMLTPDMPADERPEEFTFPVHTTLLEAETLIAENLTNLGALDDQVEVAAYPIPVVGADGAPARIVARDR